MRLNIFFILLIALLIGTHLKSQSIDSLKYWKIKSSTNINLTQGAVSNWTEGGETYVSILGILKTSANYKKKNSSWDNNLELRYGTMIVRNVLSKNKMAIVRTDDRIDLFSTYGQKFYKNINFSLMGNFRSQFVEGYDYPNDSVPVSDFMSPAKVYFALGFEYKKGENISIMVSPFTIKTTIVASSKVDETKYGLEKGNRSKREVGSYVKINYKTTLWDNIVMDNKLILFSNYLENPQNIDFDYQVNFNMKVNTFIQASLHFHFIYDDDTEIPTYDYSTGKKVKSGTTKGLQFKELLSIGFIYTLQNK